MNVMKAEDIDGHNTEIDINSVLEVFIIFIARSIFDIASYLRALGRKWRRRRSQK